MRFPNKAGDHIGTDSILRDELKAAGIRTMQEEAGRDESAFAFLRETSGEVKTSVRGVLHGWTFERAWYYWIAKGPGIDFERSMDIWRNHGDEVRVSGDCACRSPHFWYEGLAAGFYHIDTPDGLLVLSNAIKQQVADAKLKYGDPS